MNFIKRDHTNESDEALASKYKENGNVDDLSAVYQRYMDLVYGVCLKYFKNTDDAKDAVMNIYEELHIKLRKHDVCNFKAWLHQVSRNHCLMKLRKKTPYTTDIDNEFVQIPEEPHLNDVLNKEIKLTAMQICLEGLQALQKQVVELFYLQEKCYKEISELTEIPLGMVKSHIQNGRRNLKICMEKQIPNPLSS